MDGNKMIISTLLNKCDHYDLSYILYKDKYHVKCEKCGAIFDICMAEGGNSEERFKNTGNLFYILTHIIAREVSPSNMITEDDIRNILADFYWGHNVLQDASCLAAKINHIIASKQ